MNQIPNIEEVVEKFAELEHERWSKWQSWLHSQCFKNPEFTGALIIPADLVARWERQIATPYAELSEKEKESDRKQVYPYVEYFATHHQQLQKAREDWLRSEIEKLDGMTRKCEYCGKVWDDNCRDYDGVINCTCEEGNYQYGHRWDEFGFNQALTSIITRYKEELLELDKTSGL